MKSRGRGKSSSREHRSRSKSKGKAQRDKVKRLQASRQRIEQRRSLRLERLALAEEREKLELQRISQQRERLAQMKLQQQLKRAAMTQLSSSRFVGGSKYSRNQGAFILANGSGSVCVWVCIAVTACLGALFFCRENEEDGGSSAIRVIKHSVWCEYQLIDTLNENAADAKGVLSAHNNTNMHQPESPRPSRSRSSTVVSLPSHRWVSAPITC